MSHNSKISSPFTEGNKPTPDTHPAVGTFNHNIVPALSKPRDGGASLPLYFGPSDLSGTPANLDSPFKMGIIAKKP